MEKKLVFQNRKEMNRLAVQNRLLYAYEKPVIKGLLSEKQSSAVLDIGCNNGGKTFTLFGQEKVSAVVCAEVNGELVKKASKKYGNDRFSFHQWDVESDDFYKELSEFMKNRGIKGFDIIYLSFVLMHLEDVKNVLLKLKPFLNEGGSLFIVEADDSTSSLSGDSEGLLNEFIAMLEEDKYSGNRKIGRIIDSLLSECGYYDIHIWQDNISAGKGDREKKKDIFTTFFSYLPEDVKLLRKEQPHNMKYIKWAAWIEKNYRRLSDLIMCDNAEISMGIKIITCRRGS